MAVLILFPTLFIVLLSFAAVAFLGVWTYRDAKARGLNAALWVLVVLLVPSLIGLIIYLVVGRNQSVALCANCGGGLSANDQFCPKCGAAARGETVDADHTPRPIAKGSNRGPLIGFFVCLGLSLLLALALGCLAFLAPVLYHSSGVRTITSTEFTVPNPVQGEAQRIVDDLQKDGVSIGVIENNLGNQWSLRFAVLGGQHQKDFTFQEGQQLVVDSKFSSGSIQLVVTGPNGEKSETNVLSNGEQNFSLQDFQPGTIHVTLISDAKDGSITIAVK